MVFQDREGMYAQFLREQGKCVITVRGVHWFDYNGFMIPAYLPHRYPEITAEMAKEVVRISGRPFARWDVKLGEVGETPWWWLIKRGPWSIDRLSNKKKRWMVRQGIKNFTVRPLTREEVLNECARVALLAARRYRGRAQVESRESLERTWSAGQKVPGVLEFLGCFHGDVLVSFAENHIDHNAVWMYAVRHDPAYLRKYSSYGLVAAILDRYLNDRKMEYVLDGSVSIYHETSFQEHLISVFEFERVCSAVRVQYSKRFELGVRFSYPFKRVLAGLTGLSRSELLRRVVAVHRLESIRRACAGL